MKEWKKYAEFLYTWLSLPPHPPRCRTICGTCCVGGWLQNEQPLGISKFSTIFSRQPYPGFPFTGIGRGLRWDSSLRWLFYHSMPQRRRISNVLIGPKFAEVRRNVLSVGVLGESAKGVRCKKRLTIFPSPAGMSLTKLSPIRNKGIINNSRPGRVWLVTSRLGTGKLLTFYSVCVRILLTWVLSFSVLP